MHVGVIGCGKMGQQLQRVAHARGYQVSMFEKKDPLTKQPDVFVDFSTASSVLGRLQEAIGLKRPIVIGTTGWEPDLSIAQELAQTSGVATLHAPNFARGVLALIHLLDTARQLYPTYSCAGLDIHHSDKKDLPSGTAKLLATRYGIPFSSLRIGTHLPCYQVILDSPEDSITITYQAKSRESLAQGALDVALWLQHQTGWKTLDDYLHSAHHTL